MGPASRNDSIRSMNRPLDAYDHYLTTHGFKAQAEQSAIMHYLDTLSGGLVRAQRRFRHQNPPGAYLWGSVGSGKSTLMRLLYDHTPIRRKLFFHHNDCIKAIQGDVLLYQGRPDPLKCIARHWAKRAQLICIDEFEITDITTAMLIGPILLEWMKQGVCLCFTSNQPIEDIYRDGLQRQNLIPTLNALSKQLTQLHLGGHDHRPHQTPQGYFLIDSPQAQAWLNQYFKQEAETLAGHALDEPDAIIYHSPWPAYPHPMPVVARTAHIAWMNCHDLCGVPRCTHDYPILASQLNTLIISEVPQFLQGNTDLIINFISLIDAMYAQGVTLIISAQVPLPELCQHPTLNETFKRTTSRLSMLAPLDLNDSQC